MMTFLMIPRSCLVYRSRFLEYLSYVGQFNRDQTVVEIPCSLSSNHAESIDLLRTGEIELAPLIIDCTTLLSPRISCNRLGLFPSTSGMSVVFTALVENAVHLSFTSNGRQCFPSESLRNISQNREVIGPKTPDFFRVTS
jgi:hypothetical protein